MNITRFIWGIICLALAGLLVVLNLTLPPESLRFDIGDINMPWIPPVALGIIGIILLASARGGMQASTPDTSEAKPPAAVKDPEKAALNKRLESIGWGLFLIMLGGFALVPNETIPKGAWSIGVGLIMLGLNAARYFNGIRMSGFTTFLGILSLLGGIAEIIGLTSLNWSLLLIILGAYLILKPWFDQRRLFGKAEQN
jgi:hypothetical protein